MILEIQGSELNVSQAKYLCVHKFHEAIKALDDYWIRDIPKLRHWNGELGIMMLRDFADEKLRLNEKMEYEGNFLKNVYRLNFDRNELLIFLSMRHDDNKIEVSDA